MVGSDERKSKFEGRRRDCKRFNVKARSERSRSCEGGIHRLAFRAKSIYQGHSERIILLLVSLIAEGLNKSTDDEEYNEDV